jgi:hypothetical protein
MKTCTKCGIEKPVAEFSKDTSAKDGLQSECKNCVQHHRIMTRVMALLAPYNPGLL